MSISKYYIENEVGARLSLNPDGDYYITSVQGLGVTVEHSLESVASGFWYDGKEAIENVSINGSLCFKGNAFENYRIVSDFISQAKKLYFIYSPYGSKEYYKEVKLRYLTKTQRDGGGWAKMAISFEPLTLWYLPTNIGITLTKQETESIRFPILFDNSLHFGTSNIGDFKADIPADGHIPAGIKITLEGEAINPTFKLVGDDGVEYGRCEISSTIAEGETLELSSLYLDSYIRVQRNNGGTEDLIDSNDVNILFDPFLRVPQYVNCTLEIDAESELEGTAEAKIYYYYRSV